MSQDPCGMGCEEAFARLDEYVDRELSAEEMGKVREHLEACARCAREFDFEAEVLEAVREKVRRIRAPDGLRARISALLRREAASPEAAQ